MNEENKAEEQQQTAGMAWSAVKGIRMPANQVRAAIKQAVARQQITEEEGEDIFWLYSYANEYHLSEGDLAPKLGFDKNTLYQVFRGMYGAGKWTNIIRGIRKFKDVETEELKKKNIGFVETEIAKKIHKVCLSALNDGMPAFISGTSQIGKTKALEEFQRTHNHGRTILIRVGSKWSKARFVRELAMKFNCGVKATKCWALEDAIFGSITRYNLLIVDEMQMTLETSGHNGAKDIIEFIREIYDRTGCGLVLSFTNQGMSAFDAENVYDQLRRRGVVRLSLPDVPPVKDLNSFARAFDLPIPQGDVLAAIKRLVKDRGLGVYVKYLQKAHSLAGGQPLTWEKFFYVNDGYAALADQKDEY